MRLVLAAGLMVALALGGVELSLAAFSDQKANPGNTFTAAASFCSNPGDQTVKANRDAYVDQNVPGSNFGGVNDLFVRSQNNSRNKRSFVGFNLPATPSGCSVTAAKLRLYAISAASGRTIQVARASGAWVEGTITWTNQPGEAGTAVTLASGSGAGWREWTGGNMTTLVEQLYSGTNNGLVVRDQTEGTPGNQEQRYQARERTPDAQDPELVVTFG